MNSPLRVCRTKNRELHASLHFPPEATSVLLRYLVNSQPSLGLPEVLLFFNVQPSLLEVLLSLMLDPNYGYSGGDACLIEGH